MPFIPSAFLAAVCALLPASAQEQPNSEEPGKLTYAIVDTMGEADHIRNPPNYQKNDDGTVTDLVTGLMWTQPSAEKMSFADAVAGARKCRVGGYKDWRLPTIKELYSLILFSGIDPNPEARSSRRLTPFLDHSVFTSYRYGDPNTGERIIDSQYATATEYVSTTMNGSATMFGVNFADGRIKGYPQRQRRGGGGYYVMYVRGNPEYGRNQFHDNGDGTVSDLATGLTWMKADSGEALDWNQAQQFADDLELAGNKDWRLPTAKELQSIVDYTRSPDTSKSAAIDPIFDATEIKNEGGQKDWGQYWTSTQHLKQRGGEAMVYVCFGRGLGFMKNRRSGITQLMDVHGAGSQRSEGKSGDPARFPTGRGPQGDVVRFYNMVRCLRTSTEIATENIQRIGAEEEADVESAQPKFKTQPKSDRPNIILILADDLGWTGLSVAMDDLIEGAASDYYQTPNIAALAEDGMKFSRAYSPGALCTPSRASILTGQTPARLHITTPGGGRGGRNSNGERKLIAPRPQKNLNSEDVNIAEALAERGYATAHFGKWHIGRSGPEDHGFDFSDGATGNDPPNADDENPKDIHGITKRSIAFMTEQVSEGKPFYLQLSHYAVHGPNQASKESIRRFEDLPAGRFHKDPVYAGMTFDLDLSVGHLLTAIDELGLAENTYVVFYSDNGAAGARRRPNNTPLANGKGGFSEGGIRVPLIVRGPGISASSSCKETVIGYDLYATFCEWAGAQNKTGVDGMSLAPLLNGKVRGAKHSKRPLLFHFPHYGQSPRQLPQSALILGDDKMIRNEESGETVLFDLSKDLGEKQNLAGKDVKKLKEMESLLDELLKECDAQTVKPNPSYSR